MDFLELFFRITPELFNLTYINLDRAIFYETIVNRKSLARIGKTLFCAYDKELFQSSFSLFDLLKLSCFCKLYEVVRSKLCSPLKHKSRFGEVDLMDRSIYEGGYKRLFCRGETSKVGLSVLADSERQED